MLGLSLRDATGHCSHRICTERLRLLLTMPSFSSINTHFQSTPATPVTMAITTFVRRCVQEGREGLEKPGRDSVEWERKRESETGQLSRVTASHARSPSALGHGARGPALPARTPTCPWLVGPGVSLSTAWVSGAGGAVGRPAPAHVLREGARLRLGGLRLARPRLFYRSKKKKEADGAPVPAPPLSRHSCEPA